MLTAYAPPTCPNDADGVVAVVLIEGGLGHGRFNTIQLPMEFAWGAQLHRRSGFSAGNYTLTVTDFQGCMGIHQFNVEEPPAITVQLAVEDVSCFGFSDGSAAVTGVQNAVGAVNFQWNTNETTPMIDSLPLGNYSMTVTDSKGCTAVALTNVQQPEPLVLSFDVQPLVCASDSNAIVNTAIRN